MQRLQLLIFVDSISGLWDFGVYMFQRISFLIENTCFNSTIRINMFTEWRLVPSTKMLLWCNGYIYIYAYILYINTLSTFHIFPWNPLQTSFDKSLPNWPKKNNKHIIPSTSKESPPPQKKRPNKNASHQLRVPPSNHQLRVPPSNKRATNDFFLVQQKKIRETLSCT